MNQFKTGKFISRKRRELNLTQEKLAEELNVSNKTVSKWETGKCMPDYSIVQTLCQKLGISVAELMDGEENDRSIQTYDEDQIVEMLRRIQELERKEKCTHLLFKNIASAILAIAAFLNFDHGYRVEGVILGWLSVVLLIKPTTFVIKDLYTKYKNRKNKQFSNCDDGIV